jgi:hypothetical protein
MVNFLAKEAEREKHAGTKGSFSRAAKRHGMSTLAYAHKKEHAPGKEGEKARMAKVFIEAARKRKHG